MPDKNYKDRKYTVEPYNPDWKKRFETEHELLTSVFGVDAVSIEHIGSTAVQGLSSKPTIDILVTVKDISTVDKLSSELAVLGYKNLGEYVTKGARLFVKEKLDNERLVNLHVFEEIHPHVKEMIDLRDYFRSHRDVAEEYSKLKLELSKKYSDDYGMYRKYKDEWMSKHVLIANSLSVLRSKLGQLVSSENEDNWWRTDNFVKNTLAQIPPEIKVVELPPAEEVNYNCFVYALGLQNDIRFLGNTGWEYTRNLGTVFDQMIKDEILKSSDVGGNDKMILYRTDSGIISHVGIMESADTVVSKWSWGPIIKHPVFGVPDHFGNSIEFYDISDGAIEYVIKNKLGEL